ncbi:hypothetical protein D3C81_1687040 [compost metagenome]
MAIQDIHIIFSKPFQAGMALFRNMFAREPAVIRPVSHYAVHFGSQHVRFTGIAAQGFPQHLLGCAFFVDIGCVKKINT